MENYELTIVLPGKATEAKKKSVQKYLEKLIEDNKGKLGKPENWGKIDLAYNIKGNESGIFISFPLKLNPSSAINISEKLRRKEDIIRYLLIKSKKNTSN